MQTTKPFAAAIWRQTLQKMCIRDRYYSARPKCTEFEVDGCPGIYAIGDGAGFTRSLSQAAANGLYVADLISKK